MTKKTNYFYIDEAGHVNNDSKIFVHGCIKTDTPEKIKESILLLRNKITDDIYFNYIKEKFKKQGFHAVENHPDIRAQFYSILPLLNYRSYFVILDKQDDFFKNLKEQKKPHEIYLLTLHKLLKDRLIKNKNAQNNFYFENIEFSEISYRDLLDIFFKSYKGLNYAYSIVDKSEVLLSVVDYLNYIFFSLFDTKLFPDRMKDNFELVKPKIGSINFLNKNNYLSRMQKIELKKIVNLFGGKT